MNSAQIRAAADGLTTDQLRVQVSRLRFQFNRTGKGLPELRDWIAVLTTRMGGHACPRCQVNIVNTADPRNVCGECLSDLEEERARMLPAYTGD
jgi:hypothetical protein